DHELPISVYNASSVQGYAASIAQDLGDAGFNVPVADNWTGETPSTSTVYFSENEPTAQSVAQELGATAVHDQSVDGIVELMTGDQYNFSYLHSRQSSSKNVLITLQARLPKSVRKTYLTIS